MKHLLTIALTALMTICAFSSLPAALYAQEIRQERLTNKDLVEMTKSNLPESIIIAKIKSSGGDFDTSPAALTELKKEGVSDAVILALLEPAEKKPARMRDELTTSFNRLKTSVVTVWSEFGHGTGFIIDREGLILTNQHVVGPSEYIAVQFDEKRKVRAKLLAADPEKDVAVLWADLAAFPEATAAVIAKTDEDEPAITEGERVFTIGSPLNQKKIITTGIASKIEEKAIISDININHGNSGGALFNSLGEVVGITTFGDFTRQGGPGVSGIVRIEQALPLIEKGRQAMTDNQKPEARLLAVDPLDLFPLDAIREIAAAKKFDMSPYSASVGDFTVTFITPTLKYRIETEAEREAAKTRGKRNKKEGAVQETFRPFEDLRGWREYVGDYKPILLIRATPALGESFWGAFGRGVAANYGIRVPAKLRFKTDFYKMRLMCGEKEIEPIHPAKIAHLLNETNYLVSVKDATYEGFYSYPADAITPQCGKVMLELYSEKNPNEAKIKTLSEKTVTKISSDFLPYLETRAKP